MTNNVMAKAYTEVLEILKYLPDEEYNKIPKDKIAFFIENRALDYAFSINPEVDLSEQRISKEAGSIIIALFQDYFATEEQKAIVNDILDLNEKKSEKEKIKKYNIDDLFSDKKAARANDERRAEVPAVVEGDNFFTRFKKFIAKLLR